MSRFGWLLITTYSLVLAACGGTTSPADPGQGPYDATTTDTADTGDLDAPDRDLPGDLAADTADGLGTDPASPDVPGDVALPDPGPDTPVLTDPGADPADFGPGDPGPDGFTCPPNECDRFCPHGYRTDLQGCEVCECRECEAEADCKAVMTCAKPACTPAGQCLCDCAQDEGIRTYSCPGGTDVPWCACSALGVQCLDHPERGCVTLCMPGSESWACPDGTQVPWCDCQQPACVPECRNAGTADEGWFDSCTGKLIKALPCAGCKAACAAIGSKSEGWVESCGGTLLEWAQCAPTRSCLANPLDGCATSACTGQSAAWTCPGGRTVPFCSCGDGIWGCIPQPWVECAGSRPCVREGEAFTEPDGACCPGLATLAYATWDGTNCGYVNCPCEVCTLCGDGVCRAPENPCNCPQDCLGLALPRRMGETCGSMGECAQTGSDVCLTSGFGPADPVGVCTTYCDPSAADPCGDPGFVCEPVPVHQPAGFCLKRCTTSADCVPPTTCGVSFPDASGDGGCYAWGDCDPYGGWGCPPGSQCREMYGRVTCGAPGTLARGDTCEPVAADRCGPGLVCGSLARCWPICQDDAYCQSQFQMDICLKTDGEPWGHCMALE